MAETIWSVRGLPKRRAYAALDEQLRSIVAGVIDPIALMATVSCVVHLGVGHLWTGFYRVVAPNLLRVGPYQGTLGCLEIAFGRGVCGTAAQERRTIIVPDVSAFAGHIGCDSRSRSEIVVPVCNDRGELLAVFDLDSDQPAAFDAEDAQGLERLLSVFAQATP